MNYGLLFTDRNIFSWKNIYMLYMAYEKTVQVWKFVINDSMSEPDTRSGNLNCNVWNLITHMFEYAHL